MNLMDSTATPSLGNTFGAIFIGLLISTVLFGITNVQAYMFFYANPRDPIGHKIAVSCLWLVNLLYLIFLSHYLYSNLISQPLEIVVIDSEWDAKALIFMESVIISAVHFLYILRIWKLTPTKGKILPSVLTLLATVTLACELLAISAIYGIPSFEEFHSIKLQLFLSFGFTCLTDIAISVSLICILARNHTGFTWTDSSATVLYSYALNSGIFASLLSMGVLIAVSRVDTSLAFEGIRIVLSTVHVNSFIAMLNARYYFQPKNNHTTLVLQAHETSISISKFGDVHATSRNPGHHERVPTINDAGLPLFKSETPPGGDNLPKVLEVEVVKEEHSRSM